LSISLFLLFFSSITSFAQFNLYPYSQQRAEQPANTRAKETTSMPLPFWDDFSFRNTVADTLWSDPESIDVLNGMAVRPPTLGAAVFDGLKADGTPYETDATANGFTDTLVSRPIRLADVALANRDSVYLSFVYQWKGNGEAPDLADYLQVDFRDTADTWIPITLLKVDVNPDPTVFLDYIQKIEGEEFFHNNFQFRISRYGRRSGAFDTWLVDYVYLNEHRFATDFSFPDRSISTPLTALFGDYYSVPKDHFIINPATTAPTYVFATQKSEATPLNEYSYLEARNYKEGNSIFYTDSLDKAVGLFVLPFGKQEETLQVLPDFTNPSVFDPSADSTQITIKLALTSNDNLSIYSVPKPENADYDDNIYAPIDFRSNDSTQVTYTISNYYSYDDGEAEYSLGLAQAANRAAYRFTQLTTEADTLTGAYIYFPKLAGTLSSIMNILIYDEVDGKPGNLLSDEVVNVQRPGVNIFHKIEFKNAVLVPSSFYIGWEQPSNGTITIGLDRSADTSDKLFSNSNGTWLQPSNVYGSVMIRPIFDKGEITVGVESPELSISIFPNPVEKTFTINQRARVLSIHAINGQTLTFTQEQEEDQTIVQLQQASQGLAIVKMLLGNKVLTQKIVIR
jgi:hypothetical protein